MAHFSRTMIACPEYPKAGAMEDELDERISVLALADARRLAGNASVAFHRSDSHDTG